MIIIKGVFLLFGILKLSQAETCAENTCYSRGTCYQQQAEQIVCVCQDGYTGNRCEFHKVDCSRPDVCLKGACVDEHCSCSTGYAGQFCDYSDHCQENPCRDHGKCISDEDGFVCLCDKGYTSDNCENDIDECRQNPNICQNGGECQNTEGSFQCQCPAGYNGQLCGYNINECEADPCLNGGRCIDEISDFRCECPKSFSGKRCEVEATDCGCVHGKCSENPNVSCICDLGWMGGMCDKKIVSCEFNPCQNGSLPGQISQCQQYFINQDQPRIHCDCANGLAGDFCEEEVDKCLENPCRGQGNCTSLPGGQAKCDCYKGFNDHNCETDIDECEEEEPCQNGAMCQNTHGSYFCECPLGFGGVHCEINMNECASEPCRNSGSCIDGINSYRCVCRPGFTGPNCEEDIDECERNTCPSYSECVDKVNHYLCICKPGYEGEDGCEIDENECTANLCKNGGVCQNLPGDFSCQCPEGYTGKTCQFDNTACGVKPCRHGRCYLNNNITDFYCVCDPGYTGAQCTIDIDDCQRNPCLNDAACQDKLDDFYCECPPEFTGKTCGYDARYCRNNPCKNAGTCNSANQPPFYTCTCKPGYTGNVCEEEVLCDPGRCENRGRCILLDESRDKYRCECDRGYSGHNCGTELTVCGSLLCHNEGTCNSRGGKCECRPGWRGPECTEQISQCSDAPCRNGGTCSSTFRGIFQCSCREGYTGRFCEVENTTPCSSRPCLNGGTCTSAGDHTFTCSCPQGFSGKLCDKQDRCQPNPCIPGYACENFPVENPFTYICCEENSYICYTMVGCPRMCETLVADKICQPDCYNSECQADRADCAQNLETSLDIWDLCRNPQCEAMFNNGVCNHECASPECLYDGIDCMEKESCPYDKYCRTYFNNGYCDQGCNNSACLYDNHDCFPSRDHYNLAPDGITMRVNANCDQVKRFKSQATYTLDHWTRAVSVVSRIVPDPDDAERCEIDLSFDVRYCGATCRTSNTEVLIKYLWAQLLYNDSTTPFPFHVKEIHAYESGELSNPADQVSTAIISTIAVIGVLLFIALTVVGRSVYRARARLWEPDGFKPRKRNVKDISKMGDSVNLKTAHKLGDQHNFNYYLPDQPHFMDIDMEPMTNWNRNGGRLYEEHDETAPMIAQAAYEFRQRDETSSPTTQAEEQVAIGRSANRITLGRGETALHAVCRNKNIDELRRLLSQGNLDINVTDTFGRTPLYAAVGSDAIEIVDILLDVDGIDIEKAIHQKGATPLILATKMVYNCIVEKLVEKGRALVNSQDTYGRTALHWAAAMSNLQAMELLLAKGANKDAESLKKETPLFLASKEGKLEAVKILLYHNAQRHLADSMDQTPIDVARDRLHHDIEEVLLHWNPDGKMMIKQPTHVQLPGSLTPPQSDDAATGSPNSLPTLSPCEKDEREEKKNSKRKKKKTEHNPSHQPVYQTGYWAKNTLHSPPNWMSTQMLSPESLTGSPTQTNIPSSMDHPADHHQRLTHYPLHSGYPLEAAPQSYIPHEHLLSHRGANRQYPHHPHQLDYHSSPDSPEETWQITSPPNSDWSHTSP